ncbi:MAG: heparan-alpha-glucosaminide N-acetyltransferase domain-containing protein [Planctomycetota bacterium]
MNAAATPATAAADRHASIDVMRAVAIALMVVVHFAENLAGWHGTAGSAFAGVHQTWWLPTGFAAPTFTLLTGVSYRLWLEHQRRCGRSEAAIAKGTVRRGLFLIGLGFTFNVLIWLPEDVFNWDILTLIGCGMLALEAARRMPDAVVLLAAALAVAVAPTLRIVVGYPDSWTQGYFDYEFTFTDVALGWLVTGYFPIFPWLAFPLAGYALAGGWAGGDRRVTAIGLGLVAVAAVLVLAWPALPPAVSGNATQAWTMFPASTAYVLGTLGVVTLALAGLHRLLDAGMPRYRGLVAWAAPLSRHSLSLYLAHHAVHVWPLWAAGLATGVDATALWQVAMPVGWALGLAVVFLVAAAVLCRWADRHRMPTAESMMRWLCD